MSCAGKRLGSERDAPEHVAGRAERAQNLFEQHGRQHQVLIAERGCSCLALVKAGGGRARGGSERFPAPFVGFRFPLGAALLGPAFSFGALLGV